MLIEIKNRWNGNVLFSLEIGSIKLAVEAAIKSGADLRSADLRSAYLRSADLSGANLSGADLSGANLSGAYLRSADLSGANLRSADLRSADLRSAYLSGADLRGADLRGAYLSGADLRSAYLSGADLRGANLSGAYLTPIRDDLWAVLSSSPMEVSGLLAALKEGRVDGSTYEGDCACLVGTLANLRHCMHNAIDGLNPDSSRPIECFFAAIKKGDTPETNQFSKLACEWIESWPPLKLVLAMEVVK